MKKSNLAYFLFFVLLAACTEPFTIDTKDSPPVVVIYGELTDEWKLQEVKISCSSPYFDTVPNLGISGAEVMVTSSTNEHYVFTENDTVPGLYQSQEAFAVQSGLRYFLSVTVDFDGDGVLDRYEAETTVLPQIIPDSLSLSSIEMYGHRNYILFMHWQDPPEENYYLFKVLYQDSLLTAKLSRYIISDDAFFNGQYVKGDLYVSDDASNWDNDSEENRKRSVYLHPGDKIEAEISLIPKGYFDFISQCQQEHQTQIPVFSGPPSNITTNLSRGAVGYFVAYRRGKTTLIFEESNW
ncbi:MAG: DUF4249 domain-containing protein [Dysgonamonadaceae bacterium]|jgi:hypothetical protein|nr:DUF4249 domain-containing protein [Dysgonamonadaceae bacterium]